MLQREESRHDFAFIAGVVIGAAAGAIATLALAPGPGSDTREKVKQRVATLDVETVKQRAASASSTARDAAQRGKERVSEIAASRGESSADGATSIKERAASVTGMARDAAQRGKERVTEIAGSRGESPSAESMMEDLSAELTAAADNTVDVEETISEETLSEVVTPPAAPETPESEDERPGSS
jgi:gas vesicle protein